MTHSSLIKISASPSRSGANRISRSRIPTSMIISGSQLLSAPRPLRQHNQYAYGPKSSYCPPCLLLCAKIVSGTYILPDRKGA